MDERLQGPGMSSTKEGAGMRPRPARRPLALSTVGDALLEIAVASVSLYFIAFAGLSYSYHGRPIGESTPSSLLKAARYGPTIYPIMFAAIASRFLRATAALRLERGATVASLHYLLSSQTVFGAVSTLFQIRTFKLLALFLLAFWSLSPIGSQASLRVVSARSRYSNASADFGYLSFDSPWLLDGADDLSQLTPAVQAPFVSALASSGQSKDAREDSFRNPRIPMLQVYSKTEQADADGWYNTTNFHGNTSSSIIGLPVLGLPDSGISNFALETSYMYADCSLAFKSPYSGPLPGVLANGTTQFPDSATAGYLNINYGEHDASSVTPRQIVAYNVGENGLTTATCSLTTTYVEAQMQCSGTTCACTSIRQSKKPQNFTGTVLDGTPADPSSGNAMFFFTYFVSATGEGRDAYSTPLETYIVYPDAPYVYYGDFVDWIDVGDEIFSQRFSQLLNTCWLAGVAPLAVTGNFTRTPTPFAFRYVVESSQGQIATPETVLHCDRAWLAILTLTSSIVFVAGIVGSILGMARKGPDVLNSFVSLVRESPYVDFPPESSMESAASQVRRLKNFHVALRDVHPGESEGHVAVTTLADEAVGRLRPHKLYF